MEDLLQCPICYINYNHQERTPRQLNNCQHILCSECLPHLVKPPTRTEGSHIECPICKDKLFTNVTNVPRSLVIMQVMDATYGSNNSQRANPVPTQQQRPNMNQRTNTSYGEPNNPPPYSAVNNTYNPVPMQPSASTSNPYNWKPTNPFHSEYTNNTSSQAQYPRQAQPTAAPVTNPYYSPPQPLPQQHNPYYSQPVPSSNSIQS